MSSERFQTKSHWMTTRDYSPGPSLKGAIQVDVATNAWTHFFPKLKRKQLPVWTHIVISEPMTDAQYQSIGWQNRQGIEDARNLVHYYRLTADNRVVYSMGCVGHGVSLTHLNGQTICDLILERKTDLTDVFFVDRKTIPWPPEPFRTLGIKAIVGYMHVEDRMYDAKN